MTVAEVAGILRVSRTTVYELIRMWQATGGAAGLRAVRLAARCASPASLSWSSWALRRLKPGPVKSRAPAVAVERPDPPTTRVVLTSASRELRRQLSPMVWAVLEEVALDASRELDVLVAATLSRRVAAQLGVAPSTVANALLQLRRRNLLCLQQRGGEAGRFGLAVYTLGSVPGLAVGPCTDRPHTVPPGTVDEDAAAGPLAGAGASPARRNVGPDQAALDLGWSGS